MTRTHPDVAHNLALAILTSSNAPALLLDENLTVIAASTSFYRAFALDPQNVIAQPLLRLGAGEWDVPQLRSLLAATLSERTSGATIRFALRLTRRNCVSRSSRSTAGDSRRGRTRRWRCQAVPLTDDVVLDYDA
jgi:two-component system, sensor histidine kinase PdtaS